VRYCAHSIEFNYPVTWALFVDATLCCLAERHDVCGDPVRAGVVNDEAREFDSDTTTADLIQACAVRIAAFERPAGKRASD